MRNLSRKSIELGQRESSTEANEKKALLFLQLLGHFFLVNYLMVSVNCFSYFWTTTGIIHCTSAWTYKHVWVPLKSTTSWFTFCFAAPIKPNRGSASGYFTCHPKWPKLIHFKLRCCTLQILTIVALWSPRITTNWHYLDGWMDVKQAQVNIEFSSSTN